jgi:hypothetical protein
MLNTGFLRLLIGAAIAVLMICLCDCAWHTSSNPLALWWLGGILLLHDQSLVLKAIGCLLCISVISGLAVAIMTGRNWAIVAVTIAVSAWLGAGLIVVGLASV